MKGAGLLARWWSSGPRRVSTLDGYATVGADVSAAPAQSADGSRGGDRRPAVPSCRASSRARRRHRHRAQPRDCCRAAGAVDDRRRRSLSVDAVAWQRPVSPDVRRRAAAAVSIRDLRSRELVADVRRSARTSAPWIAEAARVLARGGHLIYSDFHPEWSVAGWRRTFTGEDGRTVRAAAASAHNRAARRAAERARHARCGPFANRKSPGAPRRWSSCFTR